VSLEPKHLLVVDDDPTYTEFVCSAIQRANLPVKINRASTLDQGLAYVQGAPPYADRTAYPMPTIVLLDLMLSGAEGFPILKWLSQNGHLDKEKVRVVVLTASDNAFHLQQALQLGAISYVIKSPFPSTVTDLVSKFCWS
jgi:DNA-binding response OmpR family regulator